MAGRDSPGAAGRLTIPGRRMIVTGLALIAILLAGGFLAMRAVEHMLINEASLNSALYLDSLATPIFEGFDPDKGLSPEQTKAIDGLVTSTASGRQILTIKVWNAQGRILHSNRKWLNGRVFPLSDELSSALNGTVNGQFEDLEADENESERPIGLPVLEIYTPVRNGPAGAIPAAIEFYVTAETLARDVRLIETAGWTILALLAAAVMGACWWMGRTARRAG